MAGTATDTGAAEVWTEAGCEEVAAAGKIATSALALFFRQPVPAMLRPPTTAPRAHQKRKFVFITMRQFDFYRHSRRIFFGAGLSYSDSTPPCPPYSPTRPSENIWEQRLFLDAGRLLMRRRPRHYTASRPMRRPAKRRHPPGAAAGCPLSQFIAPRRDSGIVEAPHQPKRQQLRMYHPRPRANFRLKQTARNPLRKAVCRFGSSAFSFCR